MFVAQVDVLVLQIPPSHLRDALVLEYQLPLFDPQTSLVVLLVGRQTDTGSGVAEDREEDQLLAIWISTRLTCDLLTLRKTLGVAL